MRRPEEPCAARAAEWALGDGNDGLDSLSLSSTATVACPLTAMVFSNPFRSNSGSSFTYPGSIPHMLRHGMASVDPRHEYNRSFHLLSGKIKAMRIDHDTLARGTRGVATATCRWGQDQLPEKREDGAGDEALADMCVVAVIFVRGKAGKKSDCRFASSQDRSAGLHLLTRC